MSNNYRIWVEDLGTFRSRRTKYVGPEPLMQSKRNSLQAYMDRTYGDGMLRVYIAPDSTGDQLMKTTQQYYVYDEIGRFMGCHDETNMRILVGNNEGWSFSEVR